MGILEIQGTNHFTPLNYNPTLATSWSTPVTWDNGYTAYSAADLVFSFILEGYGLILGSGNVVVWGNIENEAGGWVTEY